MKKKIAFFFIFCINIVKVSSVYCIESKIYVSPFNNYTSEINLEVEFTNIMIDEILNDGRICIVNTIDFADKILSANINQYTIEKLFSLYSNNYFKRYEILIMANIILVDKNTSAILWNESVKFMSIVDRTDNLENIRHNIWKMFSRNIIKQIIKICS
ncbi:MAG: LPS assembly lipoprotein LptE [Endomicrobium sp.]|jgi:hypothetical protein|nr:LPS assembly lipoprotein LptE [Endomicrobium sp.]